jgi:hypothetical protein
MTTTTTSTTAPVPSGLIALREAAHRQRDEAERARRRDYEEAAEKNWAALLATIRETIPADLLTYADLDARPDGFGGDCGEADVRFSVPGHRLIQARFHRDAGKWYRAGHDGRYLVHLGVPNKPEWCYQWWAWVRDAWALFRSLGEALLAAEKAGVAGTNDEDDEDGDGGEGVDLGALAGGATDGTGDDLDVPF